MKTIIVPLNKEAQNALNYDSAKPEQLIELILTDSIFYTMFELNFFSKINELVDCNIDDFEDEKIITKHKIEIVLQNDSLFLMNHSVEINKIIERIHNLFKEAYFRNTGIYFYF